MAVPALIPNMNEGVGRHSVICETTLLQMNNMLNQTEETT